MESKMTREQQKRKKRNTIGRIMVALVLMSSLGYAAKAAIQSKCYFAEDTFFQGVDCSGLNIQQAEEKIKSELENATVSFLLPSGEQITAKTKTFEPTLKQDFEEKLKSILKSQPLFPKQEKNTHTIVNMVTVNKSAVKDYLLKYMDDSKEVTTANNIPIEYDEKSKRLEASGTFSDITIDIDETCEYIVSELQKGSILIDISVLAMQKWTEIENEISERLKFVNQALTADVVYQINDTTTFELNSETIKDWIYLDENANYHIDFEGIVSEIAERTKSFNFEATGIGSVNRRFSKNDMPEIDTAQEISWLETNLATGIQTTRELSYIKKPKDIDLSAYIELDITRQTIWMYLNGECILESPCVTGSVVGRHSTPTGVYHLTNKAKNTVLRGYNNDGSRYASHVDFWMAFIKNSIGFHDASWRKGVFGGDIYKTNGSHGCVNMPYNATKMLYENITSDMPIIIYKSETLEQVQ